MNQVAVIKEILCCRLFILFGSLWLPFIVAGQHTFDTSYLPGYSIVVAGKQYDRGPFHRWLWGSHYRKEWKTPVLVKSINLDTIAGGLTPYKPGGGRQSKTLRLKNNQQKEYVLRNVDKTFGKALPPIYKGTFMEI